jgi:GT2 family glycosyltransferase
MRKAVFETCASAPVDVSVIVVTYESAADLPELIDDLRREAEKVRLRVIVVDNQSSDGSHEIAAAQGDVIAVSSGGNAGYAGAINVGSRYVGSCSAHLILNPDLRLSPGSLSALLARLRDSSEIGAVVPKIMDAEGHVFSSIRYEPTVCRAFGDALFGSRWPSRPTWLRETEFDTSMYADARPIHWATGAAVLVSSEAAERVGAWDERYFLYSEETDFMRRVRSAGLGVWFEPRAVVTHRQGGSGSSVDLSALLNVNRVRYFSGQHGAVASALFWSASLLGSLLRAFKPDARRALMYLSFRRPWSQLPRMQIGNAASPCGPTMRTEAHATFDREPVSQPPVRGVVQ